MASSAKEWKKRTGTVEIKVPSGNVALIKPVGMHVFLQRGIIPNSLLAMVTAAINDGGVQAIPSKPEEYTPEQLSDITKLIDDVCVSVVVEPEVLPVPDPGQPRSEDSLYVDEVDVDDKLFIYQYVVGGTADLESFRREQEAAVAALYDGEDAGDQAVSAAVGER